MVIKPSSPHGWTTRITAGAALVVLFTGCTEGDSAGGVPTPTVSMTPVEPTAGTTLAAGESESVLISEGSGDGTMWAARYTDSDLGGCVVVTDSGGGETTGCGFEVPDGHEVGSVVLDSQDGDVVAGPVSDIVDRVRVVLAEGDPVEVMTVSAPELPVPHFAVQVPAGADAIEVVALDSDGAELEARAAGGG